MSEHPPSPYAGPPGGGPPAGPPGSGLPGGQSGGPTGGPPVGPPMGPPYPPYGPLPGGPPPQPSGMSNKTKFWLGFVLSVPALLLAAFVSNLPSIIIDAAGGDSSVTGSLSFVLFLLMGVGVLVMLLFERTRWWALGLIAGIAVTLIVLAGACVVILAVLLGAES